MTIELKDIQVSTNHIHIPLQQYNKNGNRSTDGIYFVVVPHQSHEDKGTNHIKRMSKYSDQIETTFTTSTVKWALLCISKNAIVSAKNISGTLV